MPEEVLGISPSPPSTDSVLYARQDGAVVLHTLSDAQEHILLDPGTYDIAGDSFLIAIGFPARLSPDGQWLLVPTPDRGTWLIAMDGQVVPQKYSGRLSFTWAPDSRRFAFQQQGAIYVQDVVAGTEPALIAQIPGDKLFYPTWSPGGDSAGSMAAFSCEDSVCTVWLIDALTGHVRELGPFAPLPMMAAPDMILWAADGSAVLIQTRQGTLAFPIQGGGPQPLAGVRYDHPGALSPDGLLEAWTEAAPDSDFPSRLVVARSGTEQRIAYNLPFEQIQGLAWANDGRRLLIEDYDARERLWAVDPAVGEPVLVADHILHFGTPDQLRQRSTGVSAEHVAPLRTLPDADDPTTWPTYGVSDWPVCLRLPPTWRIETRSNSHTGVIWQVTAANFEFAEQEGTATLTEDHLEVSFEYHKRPSNGQELPLDRVKEMERGYAAVEPTTLRGHPAIRIRPLISPVSEELRVQLDGGQLWITYKPLSSTRQAVLGQILEYIDFNLPCSTPSGLVIEAYALKGSPHIEPLTFEPVQGTAQEVLQKRHAERDKRIKRVWTRAGETSVAAGIGEGLLAATTIYTNTAEGQVVGVQVMRDESVIYTASLGTASPVDKLQGLWVYDGHWYLEVAGNQERGQVIRDGESLNERDGYEETFGFQLLHGKPFYFFRRKGRIGVSFDGQETLLGYDHIVHYGCCSGAELNPVHAENMVAFFALRDGTWHYVEIGVYE